MQRVQCGRHAPGTAIFEGDAAMAKLEEAHLSSFSPQAPNPHATAARAGAVAIFMLLLAAGLWGVFRPTLSSGFKLSQPDAGDSRFNHYLLEHVYLWARGDPAHRALWTPPFGYPLTHTLALSDPMISFSPPYVVLRMMGVSPQTAFSLWGIVMAAVNFVAAFWFFRCAVRMPPRSATLAAYLPAFSLPLVAQLGHEQLWPQMYVIGACACVVILFRHDASRRARRTAIWCFYLCLVLQFYGGFYNAFFLCLASWVAIGGALMVAPLRQRLRQVFREHWRDVALAILAAGLALLPWLYQVQAAAREAGVRTLGEAVMFLPRLQSWIFVSPGSPFYRWMNGLGLFHDLPAPVEQHLGLGLLTTATALAAWWRFRRHPLAHLILGAAATLMILFTCFPGGVRLWQVIFYVIPGLQAVRCPGRIAILLVIPAAAGLGLLHASANSRKARIVLTLLLLACCLEQFQFVAAHEVAPIDVRVSRLARRVDRKAAAFVLVGVHGGAVPVWADLDAMWAANQSAVPTMNMVTGKFPRDWPLEAQTLRSGVPQPTVETKCREYLRRKGVNPATVQFLHAEN